MHVLQINSSDAEDRAREHRQRIDGEESRTGICHTQKEKFMDTSDLKKKYAPLYEPAEEEGGACRRLFEIVRILRRECPWDSVQTHESLRTCMIEEAYEAVDAVNKNDTANLKEELGDVMLQVVLNSVIAEDDGRFSAVDVINGECEKMIRRHPHIFKEDSLKTIDKVLEKWENVKSEEHGDSMLADRLTGVPKALPALLRASKVQNRIGQLGFDVPSEADLLDQMSCDLGRIRECADRSVSDEAIAEMYGRLLFSIAGAARSRNVDPEDALNRLTDEFVKRFEAVEKKVSAEGRDVVRMSLAEIEELGDELEG